MHVHDTHGPAAGRSARTTKQLDFDGDAAPTGRAQRRVAPVAPPEPTTRDAETYAALGRRSKEKVVNGGALSQITAAKFAGGDPVDASLEPIHPAYAPSSLLVGNLSSDRDYSDATFMALRRDAATKLPLVYGGANGFSSEALAEQALVQITAPDDARHRDGRTKAGVVLNVGDRFYAAPVDVHQFIWTAAMELKNKVRVTAFCELYLDTRTKIRLAPNLESNGHAKTRSVRKFVRDGKTKSRGSANTMTRYETVSWDHFKDHPYDAFEY